MARSDAEGHFEITGLAKKPKLVLSAFHGAAGMGWATTGFDGRNARVTVDIPLEPPGAIEGCVRAGEQPVPNRRVIAKSESGTIYSANTGEDGCFRFPSVAAGEVTLRLERVTENDVPPTSQVHVAPNTTVTADLNVPVSE